MARQQTSQPSSPLPEQPLSDAHGVDGGPELLSPRDLIQRFGLSEQSFYSYQRRGAFKHLEVSRPIGVRRYSKVLVDRYLAGQSTVRFGRGSRTA